MNPSSSSSSPGIPNGETPQTDGAVSVKRDAGSGGTISVNGTHPATPKSSLPSFAAILSTSSTSGRTNSSAESPSSTLLQQKPPLLCPSSGPSSHDDENNIINSTSFTIGNGITINASTQSTTSRSSPMALPPSRIHDSEGDTSLHNSNIENSNDQEDSESSDVEIYLDSFDSNTSTERMHVLSGPNSVYSPGSSSIKGNQTPISVSAHPQSPFHLPPQNKREHTPITDDQGTRHRVLDQEKHRPESASILGAYENGNGYVDAHRSHRLDATGSISNDGTHMVSRSPLSFVSSRNQISSQQQQQQNMVLHYHHANPLTSTLSPRENPPLPDMKGGMQAAVTSLVDESGHRNTSSSITIDFANLSINAPFAPGSRLTTANAGDSLDHQGQMGIVLGTQPVVNAVADSISPTTYTTLNGIFTPSASDPTFYGLDDIGNGSESNGSASENGTTNSSGVVKTPNVYINGLAPHFPEDELFKLCNEFGPIRSVRTFTRHAKESESGYGFVLFERIDDAENCINEIRRRYKNLHPTFSKQIHKIPGTNYAASPSTSRNISITGDALSASESFKAKMESLHDPTSTNLYMEGLPLSIDEPTLEALVSPHRIVSSRFFQTRLSDPPRIIAFVRLETRTGAEEVIERLHGRMVRGWNDTGSRIAVRFADTSKQRDLRKERERVVQDTDTPSSCLTMAQAALLNLRGQDLGSTAKTMQTTLVGNALSLPSASSRGFPTSMSAPDFSSLAHRGHSNFNPPNIGNGYGRTTPGLTMNGGHSIVPDYSLGFTGNRAVHSRSRSPYARECLQPQVDQRHGQHTTERFRLGRETMTNPWGSNGSVPYVDPMRGHEEALPNEEIEENFYSQSSGIQLPRPPVHSVPLGQSHLPISQSVDSMLGQIYSRPSPVYTRSGYTAAEEYIMRAHAESSAFGQSQRQQTGNDNMSYQPHHVDRGRPAPLALTRPTATDAEAAGNIAVGMRAYRTQASFMSPSVSTSTSNLVSSFGVAGERDGRFGLISDSNVMPKEDFHAGGPSTTLLTLKNLHASRLSRTYQGGQESTFSPLLPPSSMRQDHSTSSPSYSNDNSPVPIPNPNDNIHSVYEQQSASTHMRSTTLPQHRPPTTTNRHIRGHHQHSSMSAPKQNLGTPQHASVARFGSGSSLVEESSATIYECDVQGAGENLQAEVSSGRLSSSNISGVHHGNVGSSGTLKTHYSSSVIFGDAAQPSPSLSTSSTLISPTLTYGTQTPSTLSPPTPFFGSFSNTAEVFDKNGVGEKQLQKDTHGSGLRSGSR